MNKKILYLECASGISGDMTVAALLDLGADKEILSGVLRSLPLDGYDIKISRVKKAGLDVCDFDVILDSEHENHDHDMAYLHGGQREKICKEDSGEMHHHNLQEHVGHEHLPQEHHTHLHRGMNEVREIIAKGQMTVGARSLAVRIFEILAEAEAKVHGVPVEEVHFHEVGAVDSIVDIVAAAVCFDNLGITDCIIPSLKEGTGFVRCQHGILPVPVPAVAAIVESNGLNLSIMDMEGEFVTPTGAAIAAAVKTADKLPEEFKIKRLGMGAGKREYERPSILRAMFIEAAGKAEIAGKAETAEKAETDVIYKLESNIDDCTGEALGYVMDRLFEAGARDVHYMPVYMKKNRPAYQINVICMEENINRLEQIIFEETTTIGIRRQCMERSVLKRKTEAAYTSIGEAKVKSCVVGDSIRKYPEYESVTELCKKTGMSYQEVYHLIERESNGNS